MPFSSWAQSTVDMLEVAIWKIILVDLLIYFRDNTLRGMLVPINARLVFLMPKFVRVAVIFWVAVMT